MHVTRDIDLEAALSTSRKAEWCMLTMRAGPKSNNCVRNDSSQPLRGGSMSTVVDSDGNDRFCHTHLISDIARAPAHTGQTD